MNNSALKLTHHIQPVLHRWQLLLDGNAHCPVLTTMDLSQHNLLSEAMLPEIRSTACLIAAHRWGETAFSPKIWTDEADWFAARMLVLDIRRLLVDKEHLPLIRTAIKRATAFAKQQQRLFSVPEIRWCLSCQDKHICTIWLAICPKNQGNIVQNSAEIKQQLGI